MPGSLRLSLHTILYKNTSFVFLKKAFETFFDMIFLYLEGDEKKLAVV